jgi:hypothetical protein
MAAPVVLHYVAADQHPSAAEARLAVDGQRARLLAHTSQRRARRRRASFRARPQPNRQRSRPRLRAWSGHRQPHGGPRRDARHGERPRVCASHATHLLRQVEEPQQQLCGGAGAVREVQLVVPQPAVGEAAAVVHLRGAARPAAGAQALRAVGWCTQAALMQDKQAAHKHLLSGPSSGAGHATHDKLHHAAPFPS